jgi:hypothetical protein
MTSVGELGPRSDIVDQLQVVPQIPAIFENFELDNFCGSRRDRGTDAGNTRLEMEPHKVQYWFHFLVFASRGRKEATVLAELLSVEALELPGVITVNEGDDAAGE